MPNRAPRYTIKSFAELMKSKEQDSAKMEAHQNMKAHTVLRSNGSIVAIQWSDGGTDIRGSSIKSGFNIFNESDGPDERVRKLLKHLGNSVTVEKFDGRADAPTRAFLEKLR